MRLLEGAILSLMGASLAWTFQKNSISDQINAGKDCISAFGSDFSEMQYLGHGSHGQVFGLTSTSRSDKSEYVIKAIKRPTDAREEYIIGRYITDYIITPGRSKSFVGFWDFFRCSHIDMINSFCPKCTSEQRLAAYAAKEQYQYIIMERVSKIGYHKAIAKLASHLHPIQPLVQFLRASLFQIIYALQIGYLAFQFSHRDLYLFNVHFDEDPDLSLFRNPLKPNDKIEYNVQGTKYAVPRYMTGGSTIKIIDYGKSAILAESGLISAYKKRPIHRHDLGANSISYNLRMLFSALICYLPPQVLKEWERQDPKSAGEFYELARFVYGYRDKSLEKELTALKHMGPVEYCLCLFTNQPRSSISSLAFNPSCPSTKFHRAYLRETEQRRDKSGFPFTHVESYVSILRHKFFDPFQSQ